MLQLLLGGLVPLAGRLATLLLLQLLLVVMLLLLRQLTLMLAAVALKRVEFLHQIHPGASKDEDDDGDDSTDDHDDDDDDNDVVKLAEMPELRAKTGSLKSSHQTGNGSVRRNFVAASTSACLYVGTVLD